eukprot:g5185.t1
MTNMDQSAACPAGHACGEVTDKSMQFRNPCPGGYVCKEGTPQEEQYDITCEAGTFCPRGTSYQLRKRNKCNVGFYCPEGTADGQSEVVQCPRQTASKSGASNSFECLIREVETCDKKRDAFYYPSGYRYNPSLDANSVSPCPTIEGEALFLYFFHFLLPCTNSTLLSINANADEFIEMELELEIADHVVPVKIEESMDYFYNDTIEVHRACPEEVYERGGDVVTVIGRNFRDDDHLRCLFWRDYDDWLFETKATFLSSTRVQCTTPGYPWWKCTANQAANCRYVQQQRKYNAEAEGRIERHRSYDAHITVSNRGYFAGEDRKGLWIANSSHPRFSKEGSADFRFLDTTLYKNDTYARKKRADNLKICLRADEWEEIKSVEKGWFRLAGLEVAHIMLDLSHLPDGLRYHDHWRIGIYVIPSVCQETQCGPGRLPIKDPDPSDDYDPLEISPCRRPIPLSNWLNDPLLSKNDKVNITLTALEDVLFKVDIHIVHGSFLPVKRLFENTTVVSKVTPKRANVTMGVDQKDLRRWSADVSFEQETIENFYTFTSFYERSYGDDIHPPLNLPGRYKDFEKGRVLVGFNKSAERPDVYTTIDNREELEPSPQYWLGQTAMGWRAASVADREKYRETFDVIGIGDKIDVDNTAMVLPYLPYFSNCAGYDNYIPLFTVFENEEKCNLPLPIFRENENGELVNETPRYNNGKGWWRRAFPSLPNQDDIVRMDPYNLFGEPTADWCEVDIPCNYEEELAQTEVNPRWFEADSGAVLWTMLQDPMNLEQFKSGAGFMEEVASGIFVGDAGRHPDQRYGPDSIIPVEVDRSAAEEMPGECLELCFPREVTLVFRYYQKTENLKQIIKAEIIYEKFDRDVSRSDYALKIVLEPMNWIGLVIAFGFDWDIFVTLFVLMGGITVGVTIVFWAGNRLLTRLAAPPPFRFFAYLKVVAPPPLIGLATALIPAVMVCFFIHILIEGDETITVNGERGVWKPWGLKFFLFDNFPIHYMNDKVEPENQEVKRHGRTGAAFLAFGWYVMLQGAKIYIPMKKSKRLREVELKRNKILAAKEEIWAPVMWRRSNFLFTSCITCILSVMMIEFSLWDSFGDYIWYIIVALSFVGTYIEGWMEGRLKEALLIGPMATGLGIMQGIAMFGADDFQDFLFCYFVEYGVLLFERVYMGVCIDFVYDNIAGFFYSAYKVIRKLCNIKGKTKTEKLAEIAAKEEAARKNREVDVGAGEETVEPIMDAYHGYCCETLGMCYQPFVIWLMMIFRDAFALPDLYGIRVNDMNYYMYFSVIIIFFQLAADIFILNSLELFHGWKLYDYMVYSRYRFLQREKRWKGLEDSLDECIEEGMRTLDQMCFSSQFYFMTTVHVTGITITSIGLNMILKANFNIFGDPAFVLVMLVTFAACQVVKKVSIWGAHMIGLWKLHHDETGWHSKLEENDEDDFGIPGWEDLEELQQESHEAYILNQKLTSETFRHKFLNYNRPWLVAQLPMILTPRTLRRSRPYLVSQFTKILGSVNPDISSDSDSDEMPQFGPVLLSSTSATIAKLWLAQARRRKRLRDVVENLIQRARKSECEKCLSRRQLNVELVIPIEVLGAKFEKTKKTKVFDAVAWKEYFQKHQKFRTLCLQCSALFKEARKRTKMKSMGFSSSDDEEETQKMRDRNLAFQFGELNLSASSEAIMRRWISLARKKITKRDPMVRIMRKMNIEGVSSDEDEREVDEWAKKALRLSAATQGLALKWYGMAKQSLEKRKKEGGEKKTMTLMFGKTNVKASKRRKK